MWWKSCRRSQRPVQADRGWSQWYWEHAIKANFHPRRPYCQTVASSGRPRVVMPKLGRWEDQSSARKRGSLKQRETSQKGEWWQDQQEQDEGLSDQTTQRKDFSHRKILRATCLWQRRVVWSIPGGCCWEQRQHWKTQRRPRIGPEEAFRNGKHQRDSWAENRPS